MKTVLLGAEGEGSLVSAEGEAGAVENATNTSLSTAAGSTENPQ